MLSEVIARARRRLLWNALAFHFAIAVTVALAVLSLLLFLGTDILDWRWLIIVPAAPLAAGAGIAFRRLPPPYPTAQLVDRRLKLADSLSTALFFAGPNPSRPCDDSARQAQQADATRIAASVDLRQAIPIRFPRATYLAVLPAIVAAGLFDLRYRFDAHLDLRPPLAAIVQQLLQDVTSELAKLEDQLQRLLAPNPQKDEEAKKQRSDNGGEEAASIPPDGSASKTTASGSANRQQTEVADNTLAEEPQAAQQEQQSSGDTQAGSEPNSSSPRGRDGREQKKAAAGDQQAGSPNGEPSMLNKFKDSMANLLSMMKPQPGGSGKQQPGKPRDGRPEDSRKQGDQASDSANAEAGADSPQPGGAKSSGTSQSANPGADKQAGTGAGNEEGIKEIIRAEQLEAMGKLDALFGKRARSIEGEFTTEATQGPQQLKTAYQRRSAAHTDVHAKAQRDEVPVAFQEYVQRYFELVKSAAAPAKGSPRAVTASTGRPRTAR
jgi:hypothetical protein